jgi:hypothetical protein
MTHSPVCQDGYHNQCDGRVVQNMQIFRCTCECHDDDQEKAA